MKRFLIALAILSGVVVGATGPSLSICTEVSPPEQIQAPDGKLSGIAIDTVREIQKRLGNKDPIQVLPWDRAYWKVEHEPNVLLFSMARSAERNGLFQWVGPIDEDLYGFWVKADSRITIKNLDDAKALRSIGVYLDDIRDQYLTRLGFKNLVRSKDNEINAKRLMLGDLEAFAEAQNEISQEADAAGYKPADFRNAYSFLNLQLFLAFSRNTPREVVAAWQGALDEMKKDRSFERIYHKYMPNRPLPGPASTAF